jgi:hypothetical protein
MMMWHFTIALSSMIENTAFMGDLVLYLPDATKVFLKKNEWNNIFKWSLGMCQQTVFLNSTTKKMLHLVNMSFFILNGFNA